MGRILIFYFLLTAGMGAQTNPWKDKFIAAMNDPNGVSISVEIQQKQFESSYVERGTIEILKEKHYLLDTVSETVRVAGDTIQTWNKMTDQLIIDQMIEGDLSIFDLITGDFKDVVFGTPVIGPKLVAMDYDIPIMGYTGKITILKNGQPKNIKITYGPDQSVSLKINSYSKGNLKLYHSFNPKTTKVINLRE
ncbi:MAG: hypothetical protein U9N31_02950 [Candidatus Marinimicrobia bacterium]|nr:hypothetical protein [Candidatus Neomarinimicrobiota bacterium]